VLGFRARAGLKRDWHFDDEPHLECVRRRGEELDFGRAARQLERVDGESVEHGFEVRAKEARVARLGHEVIAWMGCERRPYLGPLASLDGMLAPVVEIGVRWLVAIEHVDDGDAITPRFGDSRRERRHDVARARDLENASRDQVVVDHVDHEERSLGFHSALHRREDPGPERGARHRRGLGERESRQIFVKSGYFAAGFFGEQVERCLADAVRALRKCNLEELGNIRLHDPVDSVRADGSLGGTKSQYYRAMSDRIDASERRRNNVEAPIFGFNEHKSAIVRDVTERVTSSVTDPVLVLNEAAYFEVRRLASKGGPEYAEWRGLAGSLGRLREAEVREKLRELCEKYAWDVAGNFNPSVYKFAARAMAPILGTILSPRAALKNIPQLGSLHALDGRIVVQGPVGRIAALSKLGTLVFVPTHLSNLDSVVFGFALERAGLPPATYGAGKNLFTNPVLSFFMHNLGAYRVDRRLKHGLYKDVLKAYSCILIERGYHSLFFPGGTRSRSGGIERRLKLGLAGTAIEAFARTAEKGQTQPVYFVPATLNYMLTLEAETLIDDFLQEEGKARYIIEDDESTRVGRIAAFAQKLLGLDESVVVRFGEPMDCFGNVVDESGESFDAHGRHVDAESYLVGDDGKPHRNGSRDTQYTRELGDAICAAFAKDTVVMATHIVASAAFDHLRKAVSRPADLFAILNHRDSVRISREELTAKVDGILDRARRLEADGKLVLAPQLAGAKTPHVIDSALRAFAGYHTTPVIAAGATDLVLEDTRLLFYYQNRLAAHGLAFDAIKPSLRSRA